MNSLANKTLLHKIMSVKINNKYLFFIYAKNNFNLNIKEYLSALLYV